MSNKFSLDNNYSPHISLCYGDHQIGEKKKLISKLPKLWKLIRVSKIALVEINEDINQWQIHESFDLNFFGRFCILSLAPPPRLSYPSL